MRDVLMVVVGAMLGSGLIVFLGDSGASSVPDARIASVLERQTELASDLVAVKTLIERLDRHSGGAVPAPPPETREAADAGAATPDSGAPVAELKRLIEESRQAQLAEIELLLRGVIAAMRDWPQLGASNQVPFRTLPEIEKALLDRGEKELREALVGAHWREVLERLGRPADRAVQSTGHQSFRYAMSGRSGHESLWLHFLANGILSHIEVR